MSATKGGEALIEALEAKIFCDEDADKNRTSEHSKAARSCLKLKLRANSWNSLHSHARLRRRPRLELLPQPLLERLHVLRTSEEFFTRSFADTEPPGSSTSAPVAHRGLARHRFFLSNCVEILRDHLVLHVRVVRRRIAGQVIVRPERSARR